MTRDITNAAHNTTQITTSLHDVADNATVTTHSMTESRTAIDELARMSAQLHQHVERYTT